MARWSDLAEWRGPTPNEGPAMVEQRGLVIHIAQGYYEGTISYQKNPDVNVSSHFVLAGPRDIPYGGRDGKLAQVVDTVTAAWTQRAGNGHWLSVECSGFVPDRLSSAQLESVAQLFARCHTVYGVPLQIATDPNGRGLGHHSMGCNWPAGAWGHCDCPGTNIIAQKPQIVARAQQIINGGADMAQMLVRFGDDPTEPNQVWLCDGQFRRRVKPEWVGTGGGPITNGQIHQASLLGLLGNNGAVFVSGGDKDVWGLEMETLGGGGSAPGGAVDLSDQAKADIREIVDSELDEQSLGGADTGT